MNQTSKEANSQLIIYALHPKGESASPPHNKEHLWTPILSQLLFQEQNPKMITSITGYPILQMRNLKYRSKAQHW